MYLYMMTGSKEDYEAFQTLYSSLDDERKATIDKEYRNIMSARANQGFDEQNTEEEKSPQKIIGERKQKYE